MGVIKFEALKKHFDDFLQTSTREELECVTFLGINLAELMELAKAKAEGRLVVLPCKGGTEIYYIRYCNAPSCEKCGCNNAYGDCYMEHKARIRKDKFSLFFLEAFGRSVFLTKEEAEAALKQNGGGQDG